MISRCIILAAGLIPAFCSPVYAAESLNIPGIMGAVTTDLQAADADAKAHGDAIASQCYEGVLAFQAANPLPPLPAPPVGVASTFQDARDVVKGVETAQGAGIPPAIELACGPLALDVQSDLGKAASNGFSLFGLKF